MNRSLPVEIAVQVADAALFNNSAKHLNNIELLVIRGTWQGKKYKDMAAELGYNTEYLKNNVGPKLWKLLSQSLGEKVSKNNLVAVLTQYAASREQRQKEMGTTRAGKQRKNPRLPIFPPLTIELPLSEVELDPPKQLVSPTSAFYVKRPPIEEFSCQKLEQPGALMRISAPKQMGKTSLMLLCLAHAQKQGLRVVALSLQRADSSVFTNLDQFLKWFCAEITRQLQLPQQVDDYWHQQAYGSKSKCTAYFEKCLLSAADTPLVLALDEVDEVFCYPELAKDFFSLLRSWHEEAAYGTPSSKFWQNLRLLIVHSTEVYLPWDTNQPPFNLGTVIELPRFTLEQVRDLAQRHGLHFSPEKLEQLMELLGGHPYLVRLALYHLALGDLTWEQLMQSAATDAGIYRNYLHWYLGNLQKYPELAIAYKQVLQATAPIGLDQVVGFKLYKMGLVHLQGNRVTPSCKLYHQYFREQLLQGKNFRQANSTAYTQRLEQLTQENQELKRLCNLDELTQLANRRCFDLYLFREWRRLARQGAILSLILCDIDFFKTFNDTYGHPAGDIYLEQVAGAIRQVVNRRADLVARYGGEEFAVLLPSTDGMGAVHVAEKIRQRVKALPSQGLKVGSQRSTSDPAVTISLGVVSTIPASQSNPEIIVGAANEALHQSKVQGRDRVTFKLLS
ncbi:MAG: diguanylate cyclase [Symploca sp. SIO2C1]|nr:diguanylate cyclase [Symploca sp. SIO2C1]